MNITRSMRSVVVFVAGQSPQEIQFYLFSSGRESQTWVVVGEKGLVVVWLLEPLSTAADPWSKIFWYYSSVGG